MKLAQLNNRPEIFYSIQGEGKNIGWPTIFVRLSLCNLKCVWCDTAYTWDWEKFSKQEEIIEVSLDQVIEKIQQYPCKNVVLTGGEPMLQQEELAQLMERLKDRKCLALFGEGAPKVPGTFWFEVETNTTIMPLKIFDRLIDQYNCSPKLENSQNSSSLREKTDVLKFFAQNPKANFKFVVLTEQDLRGVLEFTKKYELPRNKIYLMPEGTSPKAIEQKRPWIRKQCRENGFHFTDRLHIQRYDARRGV